MTNMCSSGNRYAQAGVQFDRLLSPTARVLVLCCTSVPVIRSSAIGCVGVKTGGLHFAMYAADTAAAETRSIDAVDRAADDVNREVRYTENSHLLGTVWYYQRCVAICRLILTGGRGHKLGLGCWELLEVSKDGMNKHHSRPT